MLILNLSVAYKSGENMLLYCGFRKVVISRILLLANFIGICLWSGCASDPYESIRKRVYKAEGIYAESSVQNAVAAMEDLYEHLIEFKESSSSESGNIDVELARTSARLGFLYRAMGAQENMNEAFDHCILHLQRRSVRDPHALGKLDAFLAFVARTDKNIGAGHWSSDYYKPLQVKSQ